MSQPYSKQEYPFWFRPFYVIIVLVLAGLGVLVTFIKDTRRDAARVELETKGVLVIVLQEDDNGMRAKLMQACEGKFDPSKPLFQLKEPGGGQREYFQVKGATPVGLPTPEFVQRITNMGKSIDYPIYTVLRHPDALGKTRKWLAQHGYSNANFGVGWENTKEYWTKPVLPIKGDSEIGILSFFEAKGRMHLWLGSRVFDVSEGLTSEAKGNEEYYRAYRLELDLIGK